MSRRLSLGGPLLAAGLAAIWLAVQAQPWAGLAVEENGQKLAKARYVLTEQEAFLPFPPELAAFPTVTLAQWSPNSRYVLVARRDERVPSRLEAPPEGENQLVLWDRRGRRSRVLWQRPLVFSNVRQIEWLPGTSVALALVEWQDAQGVAAPPAVGGQPEEPEKSDEPRRELLRIDAASGLARVIARLERDEQLLVSPVQPTAALWRRETTAERAIDAEGRKFVRLRERTLLRLVRVGGNVAAPIQVSLSIHATDWAADGSLLLWGIDPEVPLAVEQPLPLRWHAVDSASGTVRALPAPPRRYEPAPLSLSVRLVQTTVSVGEGPRAESVRPLWLESVARSDQPRALLCGDSSGGTLAPDGSAVLYLSQGAAWVTSFVRLPKGLFLQARRAALRAMAISNAKQVGLALLMYAQDYDETFPPADETIRDRLLPYVKNVAFFNDPGTDAPGFVYLYDVASLKAIQEPAKTRIGHLTGPGGRAVIFADGHVEWEDR